MKIAYIPKGAYKIGQRINVHGKRMIVESYTHTGRHVITTSLPNAAKFERVVCICTDAEPIGEMK